MRRADFANPWVRSIDEAPRAAPAWLIAVAASLLAAGVVLAGPPAAAGVHGAISPVLAALGEPWSTAAGAAAFYLCVFSPLLFIPLIAARVEGRSAWLTGERPLLATAGGLALGAGGIATVAGIAAAAGAIQPGSLAAAPLVALTAGLSVTTFQVAAEEVCFRGWLQPSLCARWGPRVGLAVTAALFAAMHLINGGATLIVVANLLLAGLLFGLLALRTGGLWAPVAAHLGWNWTEAGGLGLEPDPGLGPFSALVDLDLAGPALWTGGEARLNGSLATTLVLAALTVAVWLAPRLSRPAGAPRRSGSSP